MSENPLTLFPNFYANRAIQVLGQVPRWTVSGRLSEESKGKAPIDMRELLDRSRVRRAWARDQQCLVDLRELTERLPDAAHAAFYLMAAVDGLMVVDIEPGCPPEIARKFLRCLVRSTPRRQCRGADSTS